MYFGLNCSRVWSPYYKSNKFLNFRNDRELIYLLFGACYTSKTFTWMQILYLVPFYILDEIESELHVISNIEKIREISENLIWPSLVGTDPKTFIPEVWIWVLQSNLFEQLNFMKLFEISNFFPVIGEHNFLPIFAKTWCHFCLARLVSLKASRSKLTRTAHFTNLLGYESW